MEVSTDEILKELEQALYIYFKLIARKSFRITKSLVMTHPELDILAIIDRAKKCSITDIANTAELTLAGASLSVSRLEKKNVVRKIKNPAKQSQIVVSLTSLGKKACKTHEEYHCKHNQIMTDFLSSLDPEKLSASYALAGVMTKWMRSYYEDNTNDVSYPTLLKK